jgi:HK97 family phage portal protein
MSSPDDYRRAAEFRRSTSRGVVTTSPVTGSGQSVTAYSTHSLTDGDDPVLGAFLRGGRANMAGVCVSDRMAMRNSVFYRASSLIAGSMGMLPLQMFRRTPDGKTEKATDHPLYKVFKLDPNGIHSPSEFKSFMQLAALFDGNAYARVIRLNGEIQALVPFARKTVVRELSGATLRFKYTPPSGKVEYLKPEDVFHFRGPVSLDGLHGLGLLDVAADTLGLAHLADRAMAKLLRSGVMAGGALEGKTSMSDEAYDRLKADMRDKYSGSENAGEWMILEEGFEAKPFSGSARDSQFVELMKRQAEEGSRFTGVPRPLLMFDETAWGSGIEQLGLYFVVYCLLPWFIIWEEAIWRLLTVSEKKARNGVLLYAKFNERGLLRGSLKDQAEFMAKALGSGGGRPWSTQNEVRGAFDQNPLPGGDNLPREGTTAAAIIEDENDA